MFKGKFDGRTAGRTPHHGISSHELCSGELIKLRNSFRELILQNPFKQSNEQMSLTHHRTVFIETFKNK